MEDIKKRGKWKCLESAVYRYVFSPPPQIFGAAVLVARWEREQCLSKINTTQRGKAQGETDKTDKLKEDFWKERESLRERNVERERITIETWRKSEEVRQRVFFLFSKYRRQGIRTAPLTGSHIIYACQLREKLRCGWQFEREEIERELVRRQVRTEEAKSACQSTVFIGHRSRGHTGESRVKALELKGKKKKKTQGLSPFLPSTIKSDRKRERLIIEQWNEKCWEKKKKNNNMTIESTCHHISKALKG